MQSKQKFFFSFIFILSLFNYINPETKFSSQEAFNCFQKNVINKENSSKTIGSPSVCHSVSNQCCFINITHYYGDYLLTQEYCNFLNVNITEFQTFLQNLYEDDLKHYANFTAHNLEMYRKLGRNLDYNLVDKLNCFIGPKSNTEYSNFAINNCREFKDGKCIGQKNNTQMDLFMSNFHQKYSDAYCNKKEDKTKCIRYNGIRSNDKMILPLLEELRDYLQADNDEYQVLNNETNVDINPDVEYNDEGEQDLLTNWTIEKKFIKKCKQRPEIKVEVICPEGYVSQSYIKVIFIYLFLNLFFII